MTKFQEILILLITDYGQQCRLDGLSHTGIDSVDTNEAFRRIEQRILNSECNNDCDCDFIPIEESSYKNICHKCGLAV